MMFTAVTWYAMSNVSIDVLLGPKGCCSDIQQSSSETDWCTVSNCRLYMSTSRHTGSTHDWVGINKACSGG